MFILIVLVRHKSYGYNLHLVDGSDTAGSEGVLGPVL